MRKATKPIRNMKSLRKIGENNKSLQMTLPKQNALLAKISVGDDVIVFNYDPKRDEMRPGDMVVRKIVLSQLS